MTSQQRMLAALQGRQPDRLPVTTHHVMPYFLDKYLGGITAREFFDDFGLDAIVWTVPHRPGAARGEYCDPLQGEPGFLESRRVAHRPLARLRRTAFRTPRASSPATAS